MGNMAKHILVVDDDALMRRSVTFKLEQNSYRTSQAGTAEDALALAKEDRPDLVLLDIGLPGMDGLDALRHFQQEIDNVPCHFCHRPSARTRHHSWPGIGCRWLYYKTIQPRRLVGSRKICFATSRSRTTCC